MISLSKLPRGGKRISYFVEGESTAETTAYYMGNEAPTRWLGGGAKELGLDGPIQRDVFERLYWGLGPTEGSRPLKALQRGRRAHAPGTDLTLSDPKSLSALLAILPDGKERSQVLHARREAQDDMIGFLEREACRVRIKGEKTPALATVAAFDHVLSRDGDPQFHTHFLFLNLGFAGGKWYATESRELYKLSREASQHYHKALQEKLTALGLATQNRRVGDLQTFEVAVPQGLIADFSTRRKAIVANLAARGESGPEAAERATLRTRERKHDHSITELREGWLRRAAEHGFTPEQALSLFKGKAHLAEIQPPARKEAITQAATARPLPAAPPRQEKGESLWLFEDAKSTRILAEPHPGHQHNFWLLDAQSSPRIDRAIQIIERTERDAGREVISLVGTKAGAGATGFRTKVKTLSTRDFQKQLNAGWKAQISHAGKQMVRAVKGQKTFPLERLQLKPKHTLLVQHSEWLHPKDLRRIGQAAEKAKAKLILVGDSTTGEHRAFTKLCQLYPTVSPRFKEAEPATKFHGFGNSYEGTLKKATSAWHTERKVQGNQTLLSSNNQEAVGDLNKHAQALRKQNGELGRSARSGPNTFHVGDRVRFLYGDRRLRVTAGEFGTIERIDKVKWIGPFQKPVFQVRLDQPVKRGWLGSPKQPLVRLENGQPLTLAYAIHARHSLDVRPKQLHLHLDSESKSAKTHLHVARTSTKELHVYQSVDPQPPKQHKANDHGLGHGMKFGIGGRP